MKGILLFIMASATCLAAICMTLTCQVAMSQQPANDEAFGIPSFEMNGSAAGIKIYIVPKDSQFKWEPGMDPVYLLNLDTVQQRIEITNEQRRQFAEFRQQWQAEAEDRIGVFKKEDFPKISDEFGKWMNEFHAASKTHAMKILLPHQRTAIKQISVQKELEFKSFVEVLLSTEISKLIEIKSDQKKRIREIDGKEKPAFVEKINEVKSRFRLKTIEPLSAENRAKVFELFGRDFFDGENLRQTNSKRIDDEKPFGLPMLSITPKGEFLEFEIEVEDDLDHWESDFHPVLLLCNKEVRAQMEFTEGQEQEFTEYFSELKTRVNDRFRAIPSHGYMDDWPLRRRIRAFTIEMQNDAIDRVEEIMLPHQMNRLDQLTFQELATRTSLVKVLKSPQFGDKLSIPKGTMLQLEETAKGNMKKLESELAQLGIEYRSRVIKPLNTQQKKTTYEIFGRDFFGE